MTFISSLPYYFYDTSAAEGTSGIAYDTTIELFHNRFLVNCVQFLATQQAKRPQMIEQQNAARLIWLYLNILDKWKKHPAAVGKNVSRAA